MSDVVPTEFDNRRVRPQGWAVEPSDDRLRPFRVVGTGFLSRASESAVWDVVLAGAGRGDPDCALAIAYLAAHSPGELQAIRSDHEARRRAAEPVRPGHVTRMRAALSEVGRPGTQVGTALFVLASVILAGLLAVPLGMLAYVLIAGFPALHLAEQRHVFASGAAVEVVTFLATCLTLDARKGK